MRTTLDLDDTVLAAARNLARAEGLSLGAAVSRLARRGLSAPDPDPVEGRGVVDVAYAPFAVLSGDPDHVVTLELVNQFRDDDD
jgi:hypothetical protein